jgi:hypothetical protein
VQRNERDAALKLFYGDMRPVTDAYTNAIRDLITFQDELMKKVGKDADELVTCDRKADPDSGHCGRHSVRPGWAGSSPAACSSNWAVSRTTPAPWWCVLSEGDLTMKVETHAKDDSSLLFAMKNMVGKLSAVVTDVNSGAQALASASEEVSATAQALSQAASEQAAGVEETSASIEQMTSSIAQNTENAKVTEGMASKAAKTQPTAASRSTPRLRP